MFLLACHLLLQFTDSLACQSLCSLYKVFGDFLRPGFRSCLCEYLSSGCKGLPAGAERGGMQA